MIVRKAGDWIYVIPQVEHARHSAILVSYLRGEFLGPPVVHDQVVAATRHHDDGWERWERRPARGEDGWPLNFDNIEGTEHLRIWERSVAEACARAGAGAAAMVARHAAHLLSLHDQGTAATFHAMANAFRRQAWPGMDREDSRTCLVQSFRALFFSDAASLLALVGWEEPLDLCLYGPGETPHPVHGCRTGEWEVEIAPWPFATEELPPVPVRTYRFPSDSDPDKVLHDGWQHRGEMITLGTKVTQKSNESNVEHLT